ncbi:MAG: pyridoxine 5'-phosphate synthase [Hyphomonadaceae bacterium]|nr:pyridoxine 5'-phosphate synthase [Hyphomonadaceae bacterium]
MSLPRLGVNIDHVATVRNARGGVHPDPVDAARLAIENGADGITAHLREDRRHISDDDLARLQILCLEKNIPLNMEMAAVAEMAKIAIDLKPHAVCLVPERREERTTEGGLDAAGHHNQITPIIRDLSDNGSRVSLFIESLPHQIDASLKCGAQVVEFHTGAYAHALDDGDQAKADQLLNQLQEGAKKASDMGLEVHFGHGLTFDNVGAIAAIPEGMELNIGHFIIGESIFSGLPAALKEMRDRMDQARISI